MLVCLLSSFHFLNIVRILAPSFGSRRFYDLIKAKQNDVAYSISDNHSSKNKRNATKTSVSRCLGVVGLIWILFSLPSFKEKDGQGIEWNSLGFLCFLCRSITLVIPWSKRIGATVPHFVARVSGIRLSFCTGRGLNRVNACHHHYPPISGSAHQNLRLPV